MFCQFDVDGEEHHVPDDDFVAALEEQPSYLQKTADQRSRGLFPSCSGEKATAATGETTSILRNSRRPRGLAIWMHRHNSLMQRSTTGHSGWIGCGVRQCRVATRTTLPCATLSPKRSSTRRDGTCRRESHRKRTRKKWNWKRLTWHTSNRGQKKRKLRRTNWMQRLW